MSELGRMQTEAGLEPRPNRFYPWWMFPKQDSEVQIGRLVFGAALIAAFVGIYQVAGAISGDGGAVRGVIGSALVVGAVGGFLIWWNRR